MTSFMDLSTYLIIQMVLFESKLLNSKKSQTERLIYECYNKKKSIYLAILPSKKSIFGEAKQKLFINNSRLWEERGTNKNAVQKRPKDFFPSYCSVNQSMIALEVRHFSISVKLRPVAKSKRKWTEAWDVTISCSPQTFKNLI